MNRRNFLGRLALGAAAVLGAGMAKEAEASVPATVSSGEMPVSGQSVLIGNGLWIEPGSLSNEYVLRVHSDAAVERAVVYGDYPKTLYLRAGTFTSDEVREWMRQSGARRIEGSGADKTTILVGDTPIMANGGVSGVHVEHLTAEPPTFEAMRPPMELANHCLTCDWVGEWSADISDRTVSDGLAAYDDHARREHGGQWNRDTVWRRSLHEDGG